MARLTEEQKELILSLENDGLPRSEIAKETGLKLSTVHYVLAPVKVSKVKSKKKAAKTTKKIEEADEQEDSEVDHEAWSEYWKDRYLKAHALLVENNIID